MEYLVIKLTGTADDNQKIQKSIQKALKNIPCAEVMKDAAKTLCAKIYEDELATRRGNKGVFERSVRESIANGMVHNLMDNGFITFIENKVRHMEGLFDVKEHIGLLTIIQEEGDDEDG